MYTEEKAKNIWCPMMQSSGIKILDKLYAYSGSFDSSKTSCIGSKCAMWRWMKAPTEFLLRNPWEDVGPDWVWNEKEELWIKKVKDNKGFCGLAGKPLFE